MSFQYISVKQRRTRTKHKLISLLRDQGFVYKKGVLKPKNYTKPSLRRLNNFSVNHLLLKNKEFIQKYDKHFILKYIANGNEIRPEEISPKLVCFDSKNKEESNLFNWVKLHWSIPISAGYGRRLRYLVIDEYNNKLIGIIGLADPVYALKDRDSFIGWNSKTKANNLKHIMDGFVIGAVPPYNLILSGKLVSSLITSDKVAKDFRKKYHGKKSLISGKKFYGKLLAVTTSSAFGKSSMYDRIKIPDGPEFFHVGWTKGSGEFHFSNGEYKNLSMLAKKSGCSGKNSKWGTGPRNKRVVIREALKKLGLPNDLLYHGIKRELFLAPLVKNWKQLLLEENKNAKTLRNDVRYNASFMLNRWVIPRSERDETYKSFDNSSYSLFRKINR
ncbi:MAG: DUF4338 domain-containing protein [Candidatus Aenigmarchaeota archaeon]|nr:DUF4338 domain-containing protein [Candidatus Aenigmarchaeota archaeon]